MGRYTDHADRLHFSSKLHQSNMRKLNFSKIKFSNILFCYFFATFSTTNIIILSCLSLCSVKFIKYLKIHCICTCDMSAVKNKLSPSTGYTQNRVIGTNNTIPGNLHVRRNENRFMFVDKSTYRLFRKPTKLRNESDNF